MQGTTWMFFFFFKTQFIKENQKTFILFFWGVILFIVFAQEGRKAREIAKAYTISAPNMNTKSLRAPWGNPWVFLLITSIISGLTITTFVKKKKSWWIQYQNKTDLFPLTRISVFQLSQGHTKSGIFHILGGIGCLGISFVFFRFGLRYLIEKCLEVQRREIESFNPDIIVGECIICMVCKDCPHKKLLNESSFIGSSLGGCVASLCVIRGYWNGPTLLLAPALGKICRVEWHNQLLAFFLIISLSLSFRISYWIYPLICVELACRMVHPYIFMLQFIRFYPLA